MSSLTISSIIFCLVAGGALLGMAFRNVLPKRYHDTDSKDVVKMSMGLIATLSALVLGLVLATAKSSYDEKNARVSTMAARVILLDNLLTQYGPETTSVRKLLRQSIDSMAEGLWNEDRSGPKAPFQITDASTAFLNAIDRLEPKSDVQRSLQARAIQTIGEIEQERLLIFARSGASIPTPFLVVLVFWLATLFMSFTLFSHTNWIAIVALLVSALSVTGAIFLILELDRPFAGLIQIPKTLLLNAVPPLTS